MLSQKHPAGSPPSLSMTALCSPHAKAGSQQRDHSFRRYRIAYQRTARNTADTVRFLTGVLPHFHPACDQSRVCLTFYTENRQHPDVLAAKKLGHRKCQFRVEEGRGEARSTVSISRPCQRAVSRPRRAVSIPPVVVSNPILDV